MKTKFILSACALCGMALLTLLAACEKDNGGGDNNNNTNNQPAPTQKPFFNLDGKLFVGARNPTLDIDVVGSDTQVLWTGKGSIVDTTIAIYHSQANFQPGFYVVDSNDLTSKPKHVIIEAAWGKESSSPFVRVTSGTYELKRENNKFVGYLTNGKGKNTKNGRRYNSITMKCIYPF
jgi:hypothetical protein